MNPLSAISGSMTPGMKGLDQLQGQLAGLSGNKGAGAAGGANPAASVQDFQAAIRGAISPDQIQKLGAQPFGLGETSGLSTPAPQIQGTGAGAFEDVLKQFVGEVAGKQAQAADKVNALLSGKNIALHEVMIATEEAGVSFQLMVEVRNKLMEGYQELMRMQI